MVSVPHMAHAMHIVIALYSKHIQVVEERIQFILVTYSIKNI